MVLFLPSWVAPYVCIGEGVTRIRGVPRRWTCRARCSHPCDPCV